MKSIFICIFFSLSQSFIWSQKDDLAFYADVMANASLTKHRVTAEQKFNALLLEFIQQDPTMKEKLNLEWISEKYGSNFRVLTWQIKDEGDFFLHHGLIQIGSRIIPLKDKSRQMGESDYETLSADEWYGGYYYDMIHDSLDQHYLLFGFNGTSNSDFIKFVDVLTFDKSGTPVFGKEIFLMKDDSIKADIKSRVSVPYAKNAVIACRYDSDSQMIIHDHAAEAVSSYEGINLGRLPDGSYVAYEKKGKLWRRIDQLPNTIVEEKKPDYNKIRDRTKPDLLGRKKKGGQ
jgi:hypothetical protein